MKKLFIVRLFTVIMLASLVISPVFSQTPTVKPAVPQTKPTLYKPAPAYRSYHKPTAEDSVLMRDKTLSGQYKYMLTKIYRYQDPFVAPLYKNMRDTINADRKKLQDAEAKLAAQTKTTADLKGAVTEKDKSLAESTARVNSVNLLGIYIDKSLYNLIMWGLVIVFGATAAVVIYRSGSFSREAKYRIDLYNELDEEFKTYKAKANEKEKKLARELQTERNKVDELMGRG
jgi:hypothetical protein